MSSSDSAVDVSTLCESEANFGGCEKGYDLTLTDKVIAATGPNAHPRLAEIMPSLVRHLHNFAREVNLTVDEWTVAIDLVSSPSPPSSHIR
jgi:catechol 1,2-dioxygenase